MKHFTLAISLLISSACFASEPTPMKLPSNGQCEDFYLLIEGVCVHATATSESASEMKNRTDEFKKNGRYTPPTTNDVTEARNEDPLCTKYKDRLKRYQDEGVMGINSATGKLEKMTGEQAEDAIKDVKENIEILCE